MVYQLFSMDFISRFMSTEHKSALISLGDPDILEFVVQHGCRFQEEDWADSLSKIEVCTSRGFRKKIRIFFFNVVLGERGVFFCTGNFLLLMFPQGDLQMQILKFLTTPPEQLGFPVLSLSGQKDGPCSPSLPHINTDRFASSGSDYGEYDDMDDNPDVVLDYGEDEG
jgi:hypothetical protein